MYKLYKYHMHILLKKERGRKFFQETHVDNCSDNLEQFTERHFDKRDFLVIENLSGFRIFSYAEQCSAVSLRLQ